MDTVSIIGVGRLGGSFAIGLSRAGYQVADLIVRRSSDLSGISGLLGATPRIIEYGELSSIPSKIVIIAVPDPLISSVAGGLSGKLAPGTVVLHTSGSSSSELLSGLRVMECAVGSLHPLVSFSDAVRGAERLSGAFFCIEGDDEAVDVAQAMVKKLGGRSFTVETERKALYHASAVMACGHMVALLDVAFEMLSECGLSHEEAKEVLLPLIKGTLLNLEDQATHSALTGPFSRGDVENFDRNLSAIEESAPEFARELYLLLGEKSLKLAEQQGADPDRIAALRDRIRLAK